MRVVYAQFLTWKTASAPHAAVIQRGGLSS